MLSKIAYQQPKINYPNHYLVKLTHQDKSIYNNIVSCLARSSSVKAVYLHGSVLARDGNYDDVDLGVVIDDKQWRKVKEIVNTLISQYPHQYHIEQDLGKLYLYLMMVKRRNIYRRFDIAFIMKSILFNDLTYQFQIIFDRDNSLTTLNNLRLKNKQAATPNELEHLINEFWLFWQEGQRSVLRKRLSYAFSVLNKLRDHNLIPLAYQIYAPDKTLLKLKPSKRIEEDFPSDFLIKIYDTWPEKKDSNEIHNKFILMAEIFLTLERKLSLKKVVSIRHFQRDKIFLKMFKSKHKKR